jgi:hypothetical protein
MAVDQEALDQIRIEMLTLRGLLYALRDSADQDDDLRRGEVEHALAKTAEHQAEAVLGMIDRIADGRSLQEEAA